MILAILQARLSSTRLPGKVMKNLHGQPMILRQIERIAQSRLIDKLVVATSQDPSDDALVQMLNEADVEVRRGPLNDVVTRFGLVVDEYQPTTIVRLTADCPLADSTIIDRVIREHVESGAAYTSNTLERTFPDGLDIECFSSEAFERMLQSQLSGDEREHVTMSFYSHPEKYVLHSVTQLPDISGLRWTVDVANDLDFVRLIYQNLYDQNHSFGQAEILEFLEKNPHLSRNEIHYVRESAHGQQPE